MIKKIKYKNYIWLDVYKPSKKDIQFIEESFHFHPIVINELKRPSIRAHVDQWNDYLYFVYHTPEFDQSYGSSQPREIDFLITKERLITVHYEKIEILEEILKKCQDLKNCSYFMEEGPDYLLYRILEASIKFSLRQLYHIGERISKIEKDIFKDSIKEVNKVKEISYIKRDILNFQLISRPHQKLLKSLFMDGRKFFGKKFMIYFSSLEQDHLKVSDMLQNYRDIVESLESTNSNLVNIRINEIMKIFTILAFVTFPLTLLSSMFGMNTAHTPIIGYKYDFWMILLLMSLLTFLMFLYFKNKNWM